MEEISSTQFQRLKSFDTGQAHHHLKLDVDRMWIKTDQVNTVEWPENTLPFGVVPAFAALKQGVPQRLDQQNIKNWKRENATAVKAYNSFVEENGLFSDEFRQF